MYVNRIQITNYGPLRKLDIGLPFADTKPLPIILIGENGAGKSLFLSHIVNGLIAAQGVQSPNSREIDEGRVFKIRSPEYISSGSSASFSRVEFERSLYIQEICLRNKKASFPELPLDLDDANARQLWQSMTTEEHSKFDTNIHQRSSGDVRSIFSSNCVLYLPPNRFEEPAWLNEINLTSKAKYADFTRMEGYTDRLVIDYSRFRDIQNWLFELAYDRAVFEQQFVPTDNLHIPDTDNVLQRLPTVNIHMGHQGAASETFNFAQDIVRTALRIDQNGRIGIGRRHNRSVSIIKNTEIQIPNIFQLSSGEVSLLTMFLAIVRDFDLLASNSATGGNIRGIVIIDEIDLHLHTVQQYEILPKLMSLFPNVQFIVTSHSPLFVLGLQREFGENRIALLQLPDGKQIGAEGFEEFGSAYGIMRQTRTFEQELEAVLNQSERPVIYFDGGTDIKYLKRAAELLGKQDILDSIEVIGGGGDGELGKIWRASGVLHEAGAVKRKVVILHDCDSNTTELDKQWGARRMIARIECNPIKEGVENLFPEETLRRAMGVKEAFIDIQGSHRVTERGETRTEPERWRVNADEKSNLCEWMCENGEKEDFSSFGLIFDILAEVMKEGEVESKLEEGSSGASEGATN